LEGDCSALRTDAPETIARCFSVLMNYCCPVEARVALYERRRGSLALGGVIVTTTWCRGRTPGAAAIDLWFSLTEGCGWLPAVAELAGQIAEAGIRSVQGRRLIPFEECVAFLGRES
jgi:hypothetical protein